MISIFINDANIIFKLELIYKQFQLGNIKYFQQKTHKAFVCECEFKGDKVFTLSPLNSHSFICMRAMSN